MTFEFTEPLMTDAAKILEWRTSPRVDEMMLTSVEQGEESQKQWLRNCEKRDDYAHWIIRYCGAGIGLLNISKIDGAINQASWGYYIGNEDMLGLGAMIPIYLHNFLFFDLEMGSLIAEVLAKNTNVQTMHKSHGYKKIACHKDKYERCGKFIETYTYLLKSEDWLLKPKFHRHRANFPIKSNFH
jgi:RimJ/RimL family protein N-acetyltransferase